MGIIKIKIPQGQLKAFCHRWNITEMALFGSVLREDFSPSSDIDIMVTFEEDTNWSLLDLVQMQEELKSILEHNVDLVERQAIEQSENYIRRRHILHSMEPVYVA